MLQENLSPSTILGSYARSRNAHTSIYILYIYLFAFICLGPGSMIGYRQSQYNQPPANPAAELKWLAVYPRPNKWLAKWLINQLYRSLWIDNIYQNEHIRLTSFEFNILLSSPWLLSVCTNCMYLFSSPLVAGFLSYIYFFPFDIEEEESLKFLVVHFCKKKKNTHRKTNMKGIPNTNNVWKKKKKPGGGECEREK